MNPLQNIAMEPFRHAEVYFRLLESIRISLKYAPEEVIKKLETFVMPQEASLEVREAKFSKI